MTRRRETGDPHARPADGNRRGIVKARRIDGDDPYECTIVCVQLGDRTRAPTVSTHPFVHDPDVLVGHGQGNRRREVIGARRAGITEADAVLANSEAHRFSLAQHRRARSRNLREK